MFDLILLRSWAGSITHFKAICPSTNTETPARMVVKIIIAGHFLLAHIVALQATFPRANTHQQHNLVTGEIV